MKANRPRRPEVAERAHGRGRFRGLIRAPRLDYRWRLLAEVLERFPTLTRAEAIEHLELLEYYGDAVENPKVF